MPDDDAQAQADTAAEAPAEAGHAETAPDSGTGDSPFADAVGTANEEAGEAQPKEVSDAGAKEVDVAGADAVVQPAPAAKSFMDGLGEIGLGEKYKTEAEALAGLKELSQRVGQKTELETFGERVAPQWDEFQRWQAEQQQQQQQQAAVDPAWDPPQLSQNDLTAYLMQMQKDPEQQDPTVLAKGKAFFEYAGQKNLQRMIDPEGWFNDFEAPRVQQLIEAKLAERDATQETMQELQGIEPYIREHYAEIRPMLVRGTPASLAVELHQLRAGRTVQDDAQRAKSAQAADEAQLAAAGSALPKPPTGKKDVEIDVSKGTFRAAYYQAQQEKESGVRG